MRGYVAPKPTPATSNALRIFGANVSIAAPPRAVLKSPRMMSGAGVSSASRRERKSDSILNLEIEGLEGKSTRSAPQDALPLNGANRTNAAVDFASSYSRIASRIGTRLTTANRPIEIAFASFGQYKLMTSVRSIPAYSEMKKTSGPFSPYTFRNESERLRAVD